MRGFGFTIAVICILAGTGCLISAFDTPYGTDEIPVWLAGSLLFFALARWTLVTTGRQR